MTLTHFADGRRPDILLCGVRLIWNTDGHTTNHWGFVDCPDCFPKLPESMISARRGR